MYYSYVEIEYVALSFSPARTDLALKLLMTTMNTHNPALMQPWWQVSKNDEHNEFCGGTTSYKTADGTVVFLTQAESYYHQGPAFANHSQLEFECIIQLQDKSSLVKKSGNIRGCKPRPGFQLGSGHPLYASHVSVICIKMCTPMLAGAPPPKFPRNGPIEDESRISKWLLT